MPEIFAHTFGRFAKRAMSFDQLSKPPPAMSGTPQ